MDVYLYRLRIVYFSHIVTQTISVYWRTLHYLYLQFWKFSWKIILVHVHVCPHVWKEENYTSLSVVAISNQSPKRVVFVKLPYLIYDIAFTKELFYFPPTLIWGRKGIGLFNYNVLS